MKDTESVARKWLRLRQEWEEAQREADRADGALKMFEAQVRKDYECSTLQEFKDEVEKMIYEKGELEIFMVEKVTAFQKKWDERLK